MASTERVILGSIAFAIFWILAVFPAVPFMPIGRTAGSLLGANLMVIFRVLTTDEAYAAIDLPILGLLFGTMVVSIYLERADMFKYLGKFMAWKSRGAKDLLCRICLVSAISSAFFTNDTCCVVLTEFVLKIARQQNLPPHPFLLALASSANIGSSATPIGNPQNLVIAVLSNITFGRFLFGIFPAMLVGVVVNVVLLLCMYWKVLSVQKDVENAEIELVSDEEVVSHRFSPATMSHVVDSLHSQQQFSVDPMNTNSQNQGNFSENEIKKDTNGVFDSSKNSNASREAANDHRSLQMTDKNVSVKTVDGCEEQIFTSYEEKQNFSEKWKRLLWKICVYLVTIGMLISLLMGLNMSWTAITAALALVVLDFKDARECLEKVLWPCVYISSCYVKFNNYIFHLFI